MRNKVLRVCLFFAVFALLFAGVSFVMTPKDATEDAGIHDADAKAFLAEPENSLDVLFLGNSETYSSIVPLKIWEQSGITSYGCGTPSQKLYQTKSFLRRALACQSPKLVFLETDILFQDYSRIDVLYHQAEELVPLLRYHDRWKNLHGYDFVQPVRFASLSQNKGYVYMPGSVPPDVTSYMAPSDYVEPIPGKNVELLQKMHSMCQEKGAQLVLFTIPSTMNGSMPRHNAVQLLAQQLEVAYVDMNLLQQQIPIDWQTDTPDDGNHLNYYGAEKVSRYLASYLTDTGLFADKRQDPQYTAWNTAWEDFCAFLENQT